MPEAGAAAASPAAAASAASSAASAASSASSAASSAAAAASGAASAAAGAASALSSAAASAASQALAGGAAAAAGGNKAPAVKRAFSVQFNPSTLELYANSFDVSKHGAIRDPQTGSQKELVDCVVASSVDLTVTLIFDHVTITDAFMVDKLRQGTVNTVVSIGKTLKAKQTAKPTVQTEVEGLIGALRNSRTRTITFAWADFSFTGSLNDVSAEYTMFSVEGRPIRANVTLRIRQDLKEEFIKQWQDEFKAAFGSSAVEGKADKVRSATNLLNIGL